MIKPEDCTFIARIKTPSGPTAILVAPTQAQAHVKARAYCIQCGADCYSVERRSTQQVIAQMRQDGKYWNCDGRDDSPDFNNRHGEARPSACKPQARFQVWATFFRRKAMKCEICHEREATVHSDFGEVCSKCYDVYEEAMTPK